MYWIRKHFTKKNVSDVKIHETEINLLPNVLWMKSNKKSSIAPSLNYVSIFVLECFKVRTQEIGSKMGKEFEICFFANVFNVHAFGTTFDRSIYCLLFFSAHLHWENMFLLCVCVSVFAKVTYSRKKAISMKPSQVILYSTIWFHWCLLLSMESINQSESINQANTESKNNDRTIFFSCYPWYKGLTSNLTSKQIKWIKVIG